MGNTNKIPTSIYYYENYICVNAIIIILFNFNFIAYIQEVKKSLPNLISIERLPFPRNNSESQKPLVEYKSDNRSVVKNFCVVEF